MCEARLQLRQWVEGLGAVGHKVLDRVAGAVNGPTDDQLLGNPRTVQEDAREAADVNLLHFASVDFADGGALQFIGTVDAIRSRDWDRITLLGSSC